MKKILRKTLALIMAVFMMVSLCSVGVTAIAQDVDYYYMGLGGVEWVDVWEDTPNRYFIFEPSESGDYYFFSGSHQYTTYASLYDAQDNLIAEDCGDSDNRCFLIKASLTAGETYYLVVGSVDGGYANFQVGVDTVAVESLIIEPLSYIEGSGGYYNYGNWEEDGTGIESTKYFYYSEWLWNFNYTAVMTDGGTVSGQGYSSFEYNGKWYSFEYSEGQSYDTQWTAGNTYSTYFSVPGASAKLDVSITESPIESITIGDVDLIAGAHGYSNNYYDENGVEHNYFHYSWESRIVGTIRFADGHSEEITDRNGLYYNGEYYNFVYSSVQGYDNQWCEGNSYDVSVSLLGAVADFKVNINPSPVESVSIQPVTITEGTKCNYEQDYIGEGVFSDYYYKYYLDNNVVYSVKLTNGEVYEGSGCWFNYNGEDFCIEFTSTQSYDNQWTVGNTYTATATLMGVSCDVSYTIAESPFESVTFAPMSIIEGTNGHMSSYYDEEKGEDVEYWYYELWSKLNYTVTLKGGETISGYGSGFHYNGEWISFSISDNQRENPWTVGNTYTIQVAACGKTVPVDVTITESPIVNIEVTPILLTEADGYYREQYNPETDSWEGYLFYPWYQHLSYTVTLTDDTVINENGIDGFYIGEEWCNISYTNSQDFGNRYITGNTYTESITILGYTAEVEVTISEELFADDYSFIVQNGNAYITDYTGEEIIVEIPETIGGYSVVGILSFGNETVAEITVPDSVTMLSSDWAEDCYSLVKVKLGSGITNISSEMFAYNEYLEEINVSENNTVFTSVDGIVYDKAVTTMIAAGLGKTTKHTVPDSVTDIEVYINGFYQFSLDLGNSKTNYIFEDGILYDKDKTTVYDCDPEKTGEYVMPESVKQIAFCAFENSKLSSVKIASGVAFIEYRAFANCTNLTRVSLPDGLGYIGAEAFAYCESLEEIELPAKLEGLSVKTFYHSGIKSIQIPASIFEIGYSAFEGTPLATLTFEEGVEYIGFRAFAETDELKTVVLPDSLLYMESGVFFNSGIESVTFGSGLGAIYGSTFAGSGLKSVTLPENITYVGECAFKNCADLTEVICESSEIVIDWYAFMNSPVKELTLKEGVTDIGQYAFYGSGLESLKLPESVTDIQYRSFENSKDLAEIDISDSVESLDGFAFHGTAWYNAQPDGDVYLENSYYGYKGVMPQNTEIVIKEGTTLIADYAFSDAKDINLKSITLPASLKHIGGYAFYSSINLENVYIAEDNEYFTFENDVLYDIDGNVIWAKPIEIEGCDYLVTEFAYGEEYYFHEWFMISFACAGDGYLGYDLRNDVTDEIVVSGYDPKKAGVQTVTLTLGKFSYSYDVTVAEPVADSIYIDKLPNTTEYDLNQNLRTAGMVVKGLTDDGIQFEISDYTVSGYDPAVEGEQTVTVTYNGFTAQFKVTVNAEKTTYTSTTTEEKIEISVPKDVIEEGATLVVEKQAVEEIKTEAVVIPEEFEEDNSLIFDISFQKDEQVVQPTEEVTVSIPVPEHIDGNRCKVYHIGEDGYEEMEAVYRDGFMVFATGHFSYYGIVEATGSLLSGAVASLGNASAAITLTLYKDGNIVEEVTTVDGAYTFENIISGEYVIKAKKVGHALESFTVSVGDTDAVKDIKMTLLGDLNGDDYVTTSDLALLKLYLAGALTEINEAAADIDTSGGATTSDLARVKLYLAGADNIHE